MWFMYKGTVLGNRVWGTGSKKGCMQFLTPLTISFVMWLCSSSFEEVGSVSSPLHLAWLFDL
jgi:hypothetical protein